MRLIKSEVNGYYHEDDPGEPGGNGRRLSVNDDEARILATFCEGKKVLEIGTGLGIATKAIALKAKHVLTVDIDKFVIENIFPELQELENVDCHHAVQVTPGAFDVCLIDGLHTHDQVMTDIQSAKRALHQGGLILFHDYHMIQVRCAIYDSGLEHFYIKSTAGIAIAWV